MLHGTVSSVRCIQNKVQNYSSLRNILRLCHKLSKQKLEKQPPKAAVDVLNYLESIPDYKKIKDDLPKSLLRKYKAPESMYLINKNTAEKIVKTITNYLSEVSPIVEVNPGLGFLTQELLKHQKNKLYLYETSNHFSKYLNNIQKQYPSKVTWKIADFFGMWKLSFQDKMDQGNRITGLLGDLATEDNDRLVTIVGAMPGISFVKHLINTTVFHSSTNQLGRPDLFITMPGHHFEFLTDNQVKLGKHKSLPALFQLLFDYKVLSTVPNVHFLPWAIPSDSKKSSIISENCLYLVNITQKQNLPCTSEYLPLLWYFFKPHVFSKSTRVIPMLEQWIPGCGVWLITGQDPPDTNRALSPGEGDAPLPHMTIFTQFGDLDLQQKMTVFKRFISWPEFEQCQFRVTMENNLPKFVSQVDDDNKSIVTHMDNIEPDHSEDSDNENDVI